VPVPVYGWFQSKVIDTDSAFIEIECGKDSGTCTCTGLRWFQSKVIDTGTDSTLMEI
jgi:hypothetical protein